jgi:multidrug efflux pump subunit AcrA (membrane-fusion protein)
MLMFKKAPWKNRLLAVPALVLALVVLAAVPLFAKANPKPEPAAPPSPAPSRSEIIITGKVFASVKRKVDMPFKGVITSVPVRSGQRVEAGDVLARYTLAPDAVLAVQDRMFPPQIADSEVRLADMERTQVALRSKQEETAALSKKKLASPQSLSQVDHDLQLVNRERQALQKRLTRDRQYAQQDLVVLKQQLGESVKAGSAPREATLRAPISGYVLRVSPDLQVGAELPPTPAVILVGALDPMMVLAQAFELEALKIQPDQTADVTLESLPGKKFEARVSRVSWASMTQSLEQPSYYEVELLVPNPDLLLKEGLKARIVFRKSGKEAS